MNVIQTDENMSFLNSSTVFENVKALLINACMHLGCSLGRTFSKPTVKFEQGLCRFLNRGNLDVKTLL